MSRHQEYIEIRIFLYRGEHVWFGVGTFGTDEDKMQGLGNCYRMKVQDTNCEDPLGGLALERDIIAQAINTGSDVANIQFDLQIGNGGTGAYNSCAGQSSSMFPGLENVNKPHFNTWHRQGPWTESVWGAPYGGCEYRDSSEGSPSCDDLPPYTQVMLIKSYYLQDLSQSVQLEMT